MSGLDVDTRSDIYAMGVLLYELLTGTTPFDQERLQTVAFDEIRRIIREEEPPRPSTRLNSTDAATTTASIKRGSDPRRLSQLIRGELDWIVMKCLEKDRNRRYETANGLALDLRRYLKNEPVQACPPSLAYRLRVVFRRHRASIGTAALFLAIALFGGAMTIWQSVPRRHGAGGCRPGRTGAERDSRKRRGRTRERHRSRPRNAQQGELPDRERPQPRRLLGMGQGGSRPESALALRPDHSSAWLCAGSLCTAQPAGTWRPPTFNRPTSSRARFSQVALPARAFASSECVTKPDTARLAS